MCIRDSNNPETWTLQDTFRDLPMDAVTLLENVLDVSHVPFTHHRTVVGEERTPHRSGPQSPVKAQMDSRRSGTRAHVGENWGPRPRGSWHPN